MPDIALEIVTSTDFNEYEENTFAAIIEGRYFSLEYQPEDSRIEIRMAVSVMTEDQLDALNNTAASRQICLIGPFVTKEHAISTHITTVSAAWLTHLTDVVEFLLSWSKEQNIKGGCFLCGKDNNTVLYRNTEKINGFLCDDCFINPPESQTEVIDELLTESRTVVQYENRLFALVVTVLVRLVIATVWIPFLMYFLKDDMIYYVSGAFSIGVVYLTFACFRRAAGGDSSVSRGMAIGIQIFFIIIEGYILANIVFSPEHFTAISDALNVDQLSRLAYDNATELQARVSLGPLVALASVLIYRYVSEKIMK